MYNAQDFLSKSRTQTNKSSTPPASPKPSKEKLCYCRVSSPGQRDDLERQIQSMRSMFPNHRIVSDVGSGINFKRKGLRTILERSSKGLVEEVVVAYRDRLCRFAFELLQWVFHCHGVKLVVCNETLDAQGSANKHSELTEDLLAIINVFSCRVNGRRKYRQRPEEREEQECSSKPVQEIQTVSESRSKKRSKEVVRVREENVQHCA